MNVPDTCWIHPDVEIRASLIEGRGLFATAAMPVDIVIARLGGRIVTRDELNALFVAPGEYVDTISVDDGIDLVLPPGQPIHYANHSCDPNMWHLDAFTMAARRDIAVDEEITIDYATHSDGPDFTFECSCGTALCRGTVTGADWQIRGLQERYGAHWSPVLLDRIRESR